MIRESSDANGKLSGATEIECGKDETKRMLSEMKKKGSSSSMTNDDGLSESNLSFPIKSTLFLNPVTFMHSLVVLNAFARNWITRFQCEKRNLLFDPFSLLSQSTPTQCMSNIYTNHLKVVKISTSLISQLTSNSDTFQLQLKCVISIWVQLFWVLNFHSSQFACLIYCILHKIYSRCSCCWSLFDVNESSNIWIWNIYQLRYWEILKIVPLSKF